MGTDPRRPRLALTVLALAYLASSGCAAHEAQAPGARGVNGPDGRPLGLLRELDAAFPLYELRLEAEYSLEELRVAADSGAPEPARDSPSPRDLQAPRAADFACTCFSAGLKEGGRAFGRNFDWDPNPALVLFTRPKRGFASVSLVDISYLGYGAAKTPLADPAALARAWRIPFDGMNEKGLAVGMMAVDHAEGVSGEGRPRVGELGMIRVLLDRAASVAEALSLMEGYDIDLGEPPIHYFLADAGGDAAVVEYLGGRMLVDRRRGGWQLATNFILAEVPPAARDSACRRYARAGAILEAADGVLGEAEAFGLLKEVSQPSTRWSALYRLSSGGLSLALRGDFARHLDFSLR